MDLAQMSRTISTEQAIGILVTSFKSSEINQEVINEVEVLSKKVSSNFLLIESKVNYRNTKH